MTSTNNHTVKSVMSELKTCKYLVVNVVSYYKIVLCVSRLLLVKAEKC